MFALSRFQLGLIFLSLMLLRVVVGFHFFKEGTNKLKDGFAATKYFFADAKGPLAPFFQSMLDDPDGRIKLCLLTPELAKLSDKPLPTSISADSPTVPVIDPEFTFNIWDNFVDEATSYYGFGSPDLADRISQRIATSKQGILSEASSSSDKVTRLIQSIEDDRSALASSEVSPLNDRDIKLISSRIAESNQKLIELFGSGSGSDEAAGLVQHLNDDLVTLERLKSQPAKAEEIFQTHKDILADFLDVNRAALVSYFAGSERLTGFEKDGEGREDVALFVDSLRDQVRTIRTERQQKLAGWSGEVVTIWDSLESQINSLAIDAQAERPAITMHRPFDQENSTIKMIDTVIPWFDTIVGVLLIIGLFSRLASGAAALFLVSVIVTQPPLVPGSAPTYFYFIELAACLVIFATCAGRMGGLDFFFARRPAVETITSPPI